VTARLRFDEVSVRIERATILEGVSWEVGAGEHWALLGPNGAGKSTLLSLAAAARHPTAGTVEVLGARLGRTDVRALRRRIGTVDARTDRLVPPGMDVSTVVLTGASGTRLPQWERYGPSERTRAADVLELVGCGAFAERRYGTLSQGERQRVLLARALMVEPELLLLDEPAVGLDLPAREALLLALAASAGEHPGLASVCATHHVEELPPTTTHALLLRGGRITASGGAEDVLVSGPVSACFERPIEVERREGRFTARAAAAWSPRG
jgi:iron complex transport system ATP-binding protein